MDRKKATQLYLYAKPDGIKDSGFQKTTERDEVQHILHKDTDVFDAETGALVCRFRKGVIPASQTDTFYKAVQPLARLKSANRTRFQGEKSPYIMSNIFGFMDGWTPSQKQLFHKKQIAPPRPPIRPSMFNLRFPTQYTQTWPLLRTIDDYYRRWVPDRYKAQRRKADQIREFTIPGTAFTTVTVNLNHYSRLHTDSGDDKEGFGNLTVIERGVYEGGETCFPRYGLGVNVRTGDLLLMDVHEPHSNLPIRYKTPGAERLSIVCYLRQDVWQQGRSLTRKQRVRHNDTVRRVLRRVSDK